MKRLASIFLLSLHLRLLVAIQKDILLPGDAVLAGLHGVNTYEDGSCGKVNSNSVQIHEAVRWFFRQLNERNYISNVTLGYHGFRTCGKPSTALRQTLNILDKYSDKQGPYLIGLLGPELSSEMQTVSRLLGSLPEEDRLPQISYSATAASLKDRSVYTNLFRVIQADDMQVEVVVKLMQALNWNYIGVIFEDDAYGRGAAESLKTQAKAVDICIPVFTGISVEWSIIQIRTHFATIVNQLEKESESPVLGVVFFGKGSTAEVMFDYIGSNLKLTKFQLIVSEALALDQTFVHGNVGNNIYRRAKGLLTPSPPYYDVELFRQFWRDLHINGTLMLQQLQDSDWFVQYMKDVIGCQIVDTVSLDDNCIGKATEYIRGSDRLPVYLHYALLGAATFAKALKDLHQEQCGSGSGLCSSLRSLPQMFDAIEGLHVSPSTEFVHELPNFNLNFGFNNGEILFDGAGKLSTYDVYNFRECADSFCFDRVGTNINSQFSLAMKDIKSYDNTGVETTGAVQAQCQPTFRCTLCRRTGPNGDVFFIPGDFYIVGLVSIHNRKLNSIQCGTIRHSLSVDLVEGARYAVNALNKREGILKQIPGNATFGLVLIDTCIQPYVTLERVMAFNNGDLKLSSDINSSHILDRVIGYVGPAHSLVSVPLASIMNEVKKVYISYSSMSSTLSDKQRFPYFMRFCSPEYKEANVIMELAKRLESKYVQIIYSDEEYGIQGKEALLNAAKEREICVAKTHIVPDTTNPNKLLGLLSEIRTLPHAKVVIIFTLPHTLPALLRVLNDAIDFGEFAFIGGDGWSQLNELLVNNKLRGSFTMTQKLPTNDDFNEYFKSLNISESHNPWLQDVMEVRANCYFPKSFNKEDNRKPCTTLAQHRQTDSWIPFIINTVYALALGFNAAATSVCGGLTLCPEYSTTHLIDHLKTIQMDIYNTNKSIRIFDDNGDGNVGYTISQVVKEGQKLTYKRVGLSNETGIDLFVSSQDLKTEVDVNFTSFCQNEVECTRCHEQLEDKSGAKQNKTSAERVNNDAPVATVALAIVAALFVVIAVGLAIYILYLRKGNFQGKEDPYLSVIPDPHISYEIELHNDMDGENGYTSAHAHQEVNQE